MPLTIRSDFLPGTACVCWCWEAGAQQGNVLEEDTQPSCSDCREPKSSCQRLELFSVWGFPSSLFRLWSGRDAAAPGTGREVGIKAGCRVRPEAGREYGVEFLGLLGPGPSCFPSTCLLQPLWSDPAPAILFEKLKP